MNFRRRTVLGAMGASLLAAPALAQDYPNKPIKMIVPYPPGGGTDGLGRITAQFLSEKGLARVMGSADRARRA